MEQLILQVQETQKSLQQPETDWKDRCSSIEDLSVAVESLGKVEDYKDVARLLLSLSTDIGLQISEIRSKLVKDVCQHLIRIVIVMERDFQDMANALLPHIIGTSKNASAAIRQPGAKLLSKVSEKVRYDLALVKKIYLQSMHDKPRVLILEQLRIVFVYWSDEEMLPWESDVLEIMRQGLDDQHNNVRKVAREVICRFSSRWSERVDELLEMLPKQAKDLLVNEHRDSPLAAAIIEKYPKLENKAEKLLRRAPMAKLRSNHPKFSRHALEQNIEIHVPATPPPKQRKQQEVLVQKPNSNGVTANNSEIAATPEGTEKSSAVARSLFDTPDFSGGSDDSQQDENLGVFSGSQTHGLYAKQEIALSSESEVGENFSPRAVNLSRTASNAEETSLRHSSIRQLKDSQTPGPSGCTSSLYDKKHLESPTRFSSSSELQSSLLLREESCLLNLPGSTGPSTPVGSAHIEEDKVEPNPLSASDEYFSKPISSSIGAPTTSPLSTENVTLRARRRTLAHQEHDNLPLQPYSSALSSPKLPAPEESTQPRAVDTRPGSVALSSQPSQEAVSLLHEQYADYVHDGEDDIGQLTGGGDHIESDVEWDHRQRNDSRPQSEGESGSVENDDVQSKNSREGDTLSEECHLNEGLRHGLDSLNEVDDLMSGNFVGRDDDDETGTANEPKVSKMVWRARSSLEGHNPMQNDTKEEEESEEKLSIEVKSASPSIDALTGLQNIRKEMTDLRMIANNEKRRGHLIEERSTPAQDVYDTWDTDEEAEEQSTLKHDPQPWKEHEGARRVYLKRLTHADRLSRSPMLVLGIETPEQLEESSRVRPSSPLKTPKQGLHQATKSYDAKGRSEESKCLDLQVSHVFEHSSARVDEPGPLGFALKDRAVEVPSRNLQKDAQPHNSFDAHEQAGRFDAAEKLFAVKEVSSTQGFYYRPQSSEPERYMHSEPYQERLPPTQLGAILNPCFAKAQKNVVTEEKKEAAPTDVATEDVTTVVDAKMEATPGEDHKEVPLSDRQPLSSLGETIEMPAPDTNPLTSDAASRSTSKPSAAAQERNALPATLGWASSFAITIVVFLAAMFCMIGILRAAKKVQDSHEYHMALKTRIGKFEASIIETHKKVLKLEEDYAIWSEYVRKLTEEDEMHALAQLETIQVEVQKWQRDMKADLVAFRQALSVNSIEASFADLHVNNTKQVEQ